MEIIDLYDENRKPTGETIVRGEPMPEGRYKLSIHIWVVNSLRQIYLQKRASSRKMFPNCWENPGGGNLTKESSEETFIREFEEELGIKVSGEYKLIKTLKRKKDFVDIWYLNQDFNINDLCLQEEEVAEAKWFTLNEIDSIIKDNKVCPTFNESYNPFLEYYNLN